MPPPGWKNNPHWRIYHDVQCERRAQHLALRHQWEMLETQRQREMLETQRQREMLETQRQALNEAADVILDSVSREMKLKTKH